MIDEETFFNKELPEASEVYDDRLLNDPCGSCVSKLTKREFRSIYFYTTEHSEYSYKPINKMLVENTVHTSKLAHQISSIDSGLKKLNKHAGKCFRGEFDTGYIYKKAEDLIKTRPAKLDSAATNMIETISNDFFMSTSIDGNCSLVNSRPVEVIVIAKDKAKDISHISAIDEKEALFERGTTFIMVNAERSLSGKFLIHLAEI